MKLIVAFGLLLVATLASAKQPDYYWRDYRGAIPDDAVVATNDEFGRKTYIGNAYIAGGGMYVGQIYPGNRKIVLSGYPGEARVHTTDKFVKILCSRNRDVIQWVQTSEGGLHSVPHHLVEGGYENANPGVLYIGRTNYEGKSLVGKVIGYKPHGDAKMYFPYKNREQYVTSYEVLVYKDSEDKNGQNNQANQYNKKNQNNQDNQSNESNQSNQSNENNQN